MPDVEVAIARMLAAGSVREDHVRPVTGAVHAQASHKDNTRPHKDNKRTP